MPTRGSLPRGRALPNQALKKKRKTQSRGSPAPGVRPAQRGGSSPALSPTCPGFPSRRVSRGARSSAVARGPPLAGVPASASSNALVVWAPEPVDRNARPPPSAFPNQRRAPARPAPRADGLAVSGRAVTDRWWGGRGYRVRSPQSGPETSETLPPARLRRLRPGRPPRASGYPTLLSPPGSGGGFNVSSPGLSPPAAPGGRLSGMERPGVTCRTLVVKTPVVSELAASKTNKTKKKNLTTLSGGSLGSCVDEERS